MTMKHTLGPWTFEEDGGDGGEPVIRGADGDIVAEVYPYQGPDYREPLEAFEANAALIAAAPDLLAALEQIVDLDLCCASMEDKRKADAIFASAREAINKAGGE